MNDDQQQLLTDAINNLTQSVSNVLLQEFMKLPQELQVSFVLIKSTQLLLANVLCQVAMDKNELNDIAEAQGVEMKELTMECAIGGFGDKFSASKH